jgi:hypothetical protein
VPRANTTSISGHGCADADGAAINGAQLATVAAHTDKVIWAPLTAQC